MGSAFTAEDTFILRMGINFRKDNGREPGDKWIGQSNHWDRLA